MLPDLIFVPAFKLKVSYSILNYFTTFH